MFEFIAYGICFVAGVAVSLGSIYVYTKILKK